MTGYLKSTGAHPARASPVDPLSQEGLFVYLRVISSEPGPKTFLKDAKHAAATRRRDSPQRARNVCRKLLQRPGRGRRFEPECTDTVALIARSAVISNGTGERHPAGRKEQRRRMGFSRGPQRPRNGAQRLSKEISANEKREKSAAYIFPFPVEAWTNKEVSIFSCRENRRGHAFQ